MLCAAFRDCKFLDGRSVAFGTRPFSVSRPPVNLPMNILFFTNNRFLGGTVRILKSWLLLGPSHGLHGCVVVPPGSDFCQWLASNGIPYIESRMAWPDRRKPWQAFSDAAKVVLWARRYRIGIVHCNEHDVYPFAHLVQ